MTNLNERGFIYNREAARRNVERLLKVMKGQFQICQMEIRSWELEDVVMISNTCVILQTLIVFMQKNGYFCDEADGMNLITEFLESDEQRRIETVIEYDDNRIRIKSETLIDWDEQVVRWIVKDIQ